MKLTQEEQTILKFSLNHLHKKWLEDNRYFNMYPEEKTKELISLESLKEKLSTMFDIEF